MTIIGYNVEQRRAVMWADTETYAPQGAPSGHASKIALNPLGSFALVGNGRLKMVQEARRVAADALSLSEAVEELPDALRLRRTTLAATLNLPPSQIECTVGLVGFDHSRAALVGLVLAARNDFEPTPARCFLAPDVEYLSDDRQSIIFVAQAQVHALKMGGVPHASGMLVVAEVTSEGVRASPIFDFARGRELRRPVDLGAAM